MHSFIFLGPREIWPRLSSIDLKTWRPKDPWPLIQCLVAIGITFPIRIEAEHIDDYSTVSGYFGPGAFWAWVITCLGATFPAAGPALFKLVWSDPLPDADCEVSEIPPILGRVTMSGDGRDNDRSQYSGGIDEDSIYDEKLSSVRQLLKLLFNPNNLKESRVEIRIFFKELLNAHAESIRLLVPAKDDLELLGERAEMILNVMPSILKQNSNQHPGFIEYGLLNDTDLDQGMERVRPLALASKQLVEGLSAEFPWLRMHHREFILHLLELRNRVKFLIHQGNLVEVPTHLDPTTCSAALYPLIASVLPMLRHMLSPGHPWSAKDEASARVAQAALGFSCIAIIPDWSQNRPSLRFITWFVVGCFSQIVLGLRLSYIEGETISMPFILSFSYWLTHYFILALPLYPYFLLAGYAQCTQKFPRLFNPESTPAPPRVHSKAGTLAALINTPILLLMAGSERKHLREGNSWQVEFGFPVPRSSAAIGDLDQASALGVSLVLLVLNPFQKLLAYLVRVSFMFLGLKIIVPLGRILEYCWWRCKILAGVLKNLIVDRELVPTREIIERLGHAGSNRDIEGNVQS